MFEEEVLTNCDIDSLRFYFDSQEKNLIDRGRWAYKAGAVLSLRRKLLTMPETEFNLAIEAIDRIVTPGADPNRDAKDQRDRRERAEGGVCKTGLKIKSCSL